MKLLKYSLILFLFINYSNALKAQNQSEIRAYYGISTNNLSDDQNLDGAAGYEPETAYELGIRYIMRMPTGLGLESGVGFWTGDIEITSAPMPEQTTRRERLEITSIPVLLNYRLGEYFFINGGPVLDFQNSDNSFSSQSGMGISAGIGFNHYLQNFQLFVNPNFRQYAIIPFEKEDGHAKLSGLAVQFGMGYSF